MRDNMPITKKIQMAYHFN